MTFPTLIHEHRIFTFSSVYRIETRKSRIKIKCKRKLANSATKKQLTVGKLYSSSLVFLGVPGNRHRRLTHITIPRDVRLYLGDILRLWRHAGSEFRNRRQVKLTFIRCGRAIVWFSRERPWPVVVRFDGVLNQGQLDWGILRILLIIDRRGREMKIWDRFFVHG